MVKLNLGCWKRNFPGFINIDIINYPHVHFQRSADDLSIFEDESVDLIYASHVLEYFTLEEAKKALAEWRRVLKPSGILKVAVPDFEALVRVYNKYKDPLMLRGSIYAVVDKVVTVNDVAAIHKMFYDEKLLTKLLGETGFYNIHKYDWKEFLPKGALDRSAAYIPKNDFENGILVSLNLEASKSSEISANLEKAKVEIENIGKRAINKAKRVLRGELFKKKELYKI
ncbi:MAG: Methyltransferase family protein [Candidatus Moranbacteria bacterium GW2011_GWF2_35_39]|nr:MAG: Methyltransferase family protein [Candidatus Moranbacteria bacterium GW2011_GWF2_35_39]